MPADPAEPAPRPASSTPPASPSTVAGPTTGATSRLATTATRLTWPEIAATSGVQASWAAAGTAIASASHRGSQRAERVAPGRREQQDPAGGQGRQREARPRPPAPGRAAPAPRPRPRGRAAPGAGRRCPARPAPIVPITAARSTLGSVRASSTKPTIPSAATTCSHRPRTRHQRASASRKPTTRVRLVPETASRWVSPVARKASCERPGRPRRRRRRPAPAPAPAGRRAGAPPSRGAPAGPRRPPRHHGPGGSTTSGATARPEQAGQVAVVGRHQPTVQPHASRRAARRASSASPRTRTGADQADGATAAGRPRGPRAATPPGRRRTTRAEPATVARVGGDRADHRDRGALGGQGGHRVVRDPLAPGARRRPRRRERHQQQPGHGTATSTRRRPSQPTVAPPTTDRAARATATSAPARGQRARDRTQPRPRAPSSGIRRSRRRGGLAVVGIRRSHRHVGRELAEGRRRRCRRPRAARRPR